MNILWISDRFTKNVIQMPQIPTLVQVGILLFVIIPPCIAGYKLGAKIAVKLAERKVEFMTAAVLAAKKEFSQSLAESTDLVRTLTQQLNRTVAERNDFERRAEENRKVIETVLKERDGWQDLYDKQSIGHGNAQAIMLGAIEHLEQKLRLAGVTVELPSVVKECQVSYTQAHVLPAVQRSSSAILHRADPPPDTSVVSEKESPSV